MQIFVALLFMAGLLHSANHATPDTFAAERRSSKGLAVEGDDMASVASTATLESLQDAASVSGEDLEFVDPFERCLEALYEKRSV